MKTNERTVADEGEVEEEERHDRLMALLHELVRKHGGRRGAAKALGIDRRTVAACMDGRGMSWRMREALERGLQDGAARAADRRRKRDDALGLRVEALERELHEGLDAVGDGIEKLREEHSQALRGWSGGCLAGRPRKSPRDRLKPRAQPDRVRRRPRQQPGRRSPVSRSGCTPS